MEDLRELSRELVRDILNLAEDVEAGPAESEHVASKAEELIEVVGVISALSDEDIDHRVITNLEEVVHRFSGTRAHQAQHTQGPGRLPFDIPSAVLEHQVLRGVPAVQIAAMFGVSKRTIRRRMQQHSLRKTDLYSAVNDELDHIVSEIHRSHPNTGYKLMRGHLNARGVRVPSEYNNMESLRRVDAEGVYMRRLRLRVLGRRQYFVPGPNSLWHIDGHHKLIRFVVHGGVDGFSRLVVYLTVAGNNRAHTVLRSFIAAVEQYGLPSRVRSDKGGENADVAEFMIRSRGTDRNSHITGRSVHNQRIERMWRDVYEHALDLFYQIFTSLEDQGTLNPDNEVHLFALHWIFLPLVQQSLDSFRDAWNFHGLRTERNQSPQQLWRRYREQEYGIDWNGPHSLHGGTVSVPEVQLARELSDEEVAILPAPGVSVTDALRLYVETVEVLSRILD
uniref:Integrase catalytic domain-containing protein n=1 Tax=Gasterosteus aculeatus aculeatus TaxID=481459 RepID=A0AAQ4NS62_GASAC